MYLKINFRAYRNSHLRNATLLQGSTFAVEKETHPNPPCEGGNSGTADWIGDFFSSNFIINH